MALRLLIHMALASAIAVVAWRLRTLTTGGAVAAAATGTVALTAGWNWAILLLAYFVSNILVSKIGAARKEPLLASVVAKGGPRDQTQVLANGLVFLLAAVAWSLNAHPLALVAGAAALAASTADTWATEIGALWKKQPRLILTGRQVAPGESGGVTPPGYIAAVAGSMFLTAIAVMLGWPSSLWPAIAAGGVAGATADSIFGAFLQQKLWCATCGSVTEREIHSCGAQTMHRSGIRWMDNDVVNLFSTATGVLVAILVAAALRI